MALVWSLIAAVLLVVCLYQAVHRKLIQRATLIMQREAQQQTDRIVQASLATHLPPQQIPQQSTIVADVWGKGVLVFEYDLDLTALTPAQRQWLQATHLVPLFDHQAQAAGITPVSGAPHPFVITDWWTYEQQLHIDVANVRNEATREYVADLKKLG